MQYTPTLSRPVHWIVLIVAAVAVTLFLYFIDEGRYSLEDLFTLGNGIAMSMYLLGLLLGLFLMARLFAHRRPGPVRTALVLSIGTVVGFAFGLVLIFGLGALMRLG